MTSGISLTCAQLGGYFLRRNINYVDEWSGCQKALQARTMRAQYQSIRSVLIAAFRSVSSIRCISNVLYPGRWHWGKSFIMKSLQSEEYLIRVTYLTSEICDIAPFLSKWSNIEVIDKRNHLLEVKASPNFIGLCFSFVLPSSLIYNWPLFYFTRSHLSTECVSDRGDEAFHQLLSDYDTGLSTGDISRPRKLKVCC